MPRRRIREVSEYLWSRGVPALVLFAAMVIAYLCCLPRDLFKGTCYSTVVEDVNGELLGARISDDEQWRFPPVDSVPEKFAASITEFEDRWFRWHRGVNPFSIVRAAVGNIKAGKVTSGGSTITMQVIRLSRQGAKRSLGEKMIEAVLASRLELRCSKEEILALYASHAPFGGNVVGLEAASWRYFGRPPEELSWGESAVLAVLPNSPAMIHPGKNREKLLAKRDRLLDRLRERGYMDDTELELAKDEPLPDEPLPLPQEASHLVEYYCKAFPGQRIRVSLNISLQRQVQAIADRWNDELAKSGINDLAAVVEDVRTGEILAYVGNANPERERPGAKVDIARSPRSTGSVLKPILYCAMLQEGELLPHSLLPDIPVNINGFSPQNFDRQFNGAVHADEALSRSLNVPSVHELRQFGVPRFLDILRRCGISTLTGSADHYGLSLILGGGECTLAEITSMYSKLSASYMYSDTSKTKEDARLRNFPLKDKCAAWWTFEALKEVNRPDEIDLSLVRSAKKIAWKTGTSYGFRDGWAVGVNSEYAVGVWAGNAQGQGAPGLVGGRTAGPVMFDIFNALPSLGVQNGYARSGWFLEPAPGDYIMAETCSESGFLHGPNCESADTLMLPRKAVRSRPCPYHRTVNGVKTFVLPPAMEWYYRSLHPEYSPYVPEDRENHEFMEFIYPENGARIHIPRQLDGSVTGVNFSLAHRISGTTVFWHLDNDYVGETRLLHQLLLTPEPGKHNVTAVDEYGNSVSVSFSVD